MAANSCGVLPTGSEAMPISRSCTSGMRGIAAISLPSVAMMAGARKTRKMRKMGSS